MASNNVQQLLALRSTADEPRDAHIPCAINAPALLIKSAPTVLEAMPTIFVGIVDTDYTENHWKDHRERIKSLFNITDDSVCELRVNNRGNQTVDGQKLALEMQAAVEVINRYIFDKIRIVKMGIGSSEAVDEAVESLVRAWNKPANDKYIQLLAIGDSIDQLNLNFCKMLCLKELCNTIQYYNTMDYNIYGYVRSNPPLLRLLSALQDTTGAQPDD